MKGLGETERKQIRVYTLSGLLICFFFFIFQNWSYVTDFFAKVNSGLAPFIWGFVIAFIVVPVRRIVENAWLSKTSMKPRTKRIIGVVVSMVIFVLVLVLFFAMLIPQLVSSTQTLASSMDSYIKSFQEVLSGIVKQNAQAEQFLTDIYGRVTQALETWLSGENGSLSTIVSYSVTLVQNITNFLIGVIVAIYLLLDTEKWKRQLRRVNYAVFSEKVADGILYFLRLCKQMLNSFIFGKALDSLIIGLVCGLVCAILGIPYTPLIAFIIGITNMIPVFGPFIGAIPCIFILLIIDPIQALEFTIFIIILQQVDGNILGPRILGGSMGLPALWVMFAILVGGSLWGVIGMFLGVPIFSVFYVLIRDFVTKRLGQKNLNIE
jgi:predicted PurR-regulated permease PerM